VFVDPNPQCTFWQVDPTTGEYTGVSFEAAAPPGGSASNKCCGLGFTTAWNTSAGVLFGIQQCDTPTPGDQIAGYFICNVTIKDTTPPETTCALAGTLQGSVYISPVTVTLTATDDLSGVDYTMYQVDSGSWTTYVTPFTVSSEGAHTVAFYSMDKAGNKEAEKSQGFAIRYFNITITGGIGVTAVITNIGTIDQTSVPWSIALDGKLIFIGKTKSGTVNIAIGGHSSVKDFVLGFGKTTITVTAGIEEQTVHAKVFLFFVMGIT
jgi:hypothetical protein